MIIDYDNLDKGSKDYFDYYLLGNMSKVLILEVSI